jgi:hypothetical protein
MICRDGVSGFAQSPYPYRMLSVGGSSLGLELNTSLSNSYMYSGLSRKCVRSDDWKDGLNAANEPWRAWAREVSQQTEVKERYAVKAQWIEKKELGSQNVRGHLPYATSVRAMRTMVLRAADVGRLGDKSNL